jgi:hypothetical protein
VGIEGVPGAVPQLPYQTEQAALRMVTLTKSEERSKSGGEQWKREANDGWKSWEGSKVQNPQSRGTCGQFSTLGFERAGHEGQGSSPGLDVSRVSAPDIRYCQIKTTPCVEKKDLLDPDHRAVTLFGFRVETLG